MAAVTSPGRADRKVTLVWILAIWAFVLFGFGADFSRFTHEAPAPPLILALHGAFSVTWLGLVSTQVVLAETGQIRLHRRLGWGVVSVSTGMVPLGAVAALVDMARQVGHPDYAPQFLGEEFQDIAAFAVCTTAGVLTRKNRAEHSRFMVLAAVALMDVGPGRIATNLVSAAAPTSVLAVWLTYYWGTALLLVGMVAWDLIRLRRVTRAVMLGAALLLGGEWVVSGLYFSPAWQTAMAGLVRAWGWAG
jgi:FtsH-binding integral membrane protein